MLPLRHWTIKGDVLWTEEGHRLSWRMMLRARGGEAEFKVVDKKSGEVLAFSNEELLNKKQRSRLNAPDVPGKWAQKFNHNFKEKKNEEEGKVAGTKVRTNRNQ